MPRLACWFLTATALAGCASLAPGAVQTQRERPLLVVEGRTWNAPLLNPHPPEYGLGAPGGCIVQREFQVAIERLAYDTANGRLRMEGRLLSRPDGQVVVGILLTRDESGQPVRRVAASNHTFVLDIDLEHNPTLTLSALAYRTLEVDLRKLGRRAARAPAGSRP